MKDRFDVVIAGGGLTGLTCAALLAASEQSHRMQIRVVDAGRRPRFSPEDDVALRVTALSVGSGDIYRSLGIRERILEARACPFVEMRVWDATRPAFGQEALHFDAAEFAVPALGHIVENVLAMDALLEFLADLKIDVAYDRQITGLRETGSGHLVEFADGDSIEADLVVGADGANSFVRRYTGIAITTWRYPQSALVTHLEPTEAHRNCAWQRFLADGPLALLPLGDGRVSVVWSTAPDEAQAALAMSEKTLGERLTEASDRVLGPLTVAAPRASFPLKAQYAAHYVKPGLALIGDAAHNIHPLAGQGANLGIADATELARVVGAALAGGEHPGDSYVLRRFERARKGANQTMLHFVDALNRLFSSPSPALAALRNGGMRLFNNSGPLRRRAVAIALGVNANR